MTSVAEIAEAVDSERPRPTTWQILVLVAYVGLGVAGLVMIGIRAKTSAWEHGAAVGFLLPVAILVGLVMRRRWAWIVALIFSVAAVILVVVKHGPGVAWLAYDVMPLLLLVSPSMRQYINGRKRLAKKVSD